MQLGSRKVARNKKYFYLPFYLKYHKSHASKSREVLLVRIAPLGFASGCKIRTRSASLHSYSFSA